MGRFRYRFGVPCWLFDVPPATVPLSFVWLTANKALVTYDVPRALVREFVPEDGAEYKTSWMFSVDPATGERRGVCRLVNMNTGDAREIGTWTGPVLQDEQKADLLRRMVEPPC